jgi:hypothetical protein
MTGRTPPINDYSLNGIAFSADIGLHKREVTALGAFEIETKHSTKQAQAHQFSAHDAKDHQFEVPSEEPTSRFPHRANPDPTASS